MTTVITGTSRGIGAGLADAYRARGEDVFGTSRGTGAEIQLDVTQPSGHSAMAATLGDRAVDLLICNAGVYLDKGHDLETGFGADLWAQTFAANVTGVFLSVQALLPHLRRAAAPRIAIISSQMGSSTRAGGKSYIYRSSKAAALNLGRNLAVDLKPEGIAVGIYHPGWVQTDMGSMDADIDVATSVAGLVARFDALDLATTGCFEMWNGDPMPM
ncbi:SDR family NAD(P)-dependent oxidoreductase [Sulfitobacter albidus]|uniref:SDR family NAD(P)-dependent oxidoreductase n=1 Tax=Sulfitobacter albidus TaxID=2829501 RepID=A0A975JBW7_9RHOB|nr:SDR family NAD(P)-dependent oxidoreductase [Sulfitobacter albidus]QUJ75637.1 SDR family NAD(P)-dependent oxidoreductase [Sulfitobacter albidus]